MQARKFARGALRAGVEGLANGERTMSEIAEVLGASLGSVNGVVQRYGLGDRIKRAKHHVASVRVERDRLREELAAAKARIAALELVASPDYRLAPHLQRIVEASETAPYWDTANDRLVVPDALHRSFAEAGDGRPMPPMGDELMTAGLSAEDARFVAVQLAQNGWTLKLVAARAHLGAKP